MSGPSMKLALAASLLLNLFILGAAAGAWFWRTTPEASQRSEQGIAAAAQHLKPPLRQAFRQALADARRDVRSESQAAREARDKLAGLLKAEDLDRQAINATLEVTRTADLKVRARVEEAVIDFAERLDPQNRAALVEGLASRGQMLPRETKK